MQPIKNDEIKVHPDSCKGCKNNGGHFCMDKQHMTSSGIGLLNRKQPFVPPPWCIDPEVKTLRLLTGKTK